MLLYSVLCPEGPAPPSGHRWSPTSVVGRLRNLAPECTYCLRAEIATPSFLNPQPPLRIRHRVPVYLAVGVYRVHGWILAFLKHG